MFEEESSEANVVVRFTIPRGKSEITVSESISFAFQVCQKFGLMIDWIQEERLLEMLRKGSLDEASVIVLDPFYGEIYDEICRHCLTGDLTVVGPSCLVSCLQRNMSVPQTRLPIYSSAMRGLVVTSSGLETWESSRTRELVEAMSGEWSSSLHSGVTHLVTRTVLSEKYKVASSLGLPAMAVTWLEDVWRSCECPQVTGEDAVFSIHEVQPLLGVRLCLSQLGRADRAMLRKEVEEAGGEVSGVLDRDTTVLVCVSQGGDKWRSAVRWGIPCVTTAWILDTLDRGRFLDTTDYQLEEREERREPVVQPQPQPQPELHPAAPCKAARPDPAREPRPTKAVTKIDLEGLGLAEVKKAGTFLDGCTVFLALAGRTEEATSTSLHLAKVLKYAGAVRLTQLTERVTHVVVESLQERNNIAKQLEQLDITPAMVEVGWILASMKAGGPAPVQPDQPPAETEAPPDLTVTGNQECSWDTINTFNTFASADQSNFEEDLLAYYR